MPKFIINYLTVILSLVVLEGILYIKDYSDLLVWNCYIKHEIINNDLKDFSNEILKFEIEEDGKYSIVLKRKSLFDVGKYKNIKYNGIVE